MFGSRVRVSLAAFAALFFLTSTQRLKADDELLRTAVANHKATLDTIHTLHTLHCKLEKTFSPFEMGGKKAKPVESESGEYWRINGDCRGRSRMGKRFSEGSFREGVTRSYSFGAEKTGDFKRRQNLHCRFAAHLRRAELRDDDLLRG